MQICVNLQKYWNNAMSNDGLTIEEYTYKFECTQNKFCVSTWTRHKKAKTKVTIYMFFKFYFGVFKRNKW